MWAEFWFILFVACLGAYIGLRYDYKRLKDLSEACIFMAKVEIASYHYKLAVLQSVTPTDAYKIYYHGFMEAYNEHRNNKKVQEVVAEMKLDIDAEMNRITDLEQKRRVESFLRKEK